MLQRMPKASEEESQPRSTARLPQPISASEAYRATKLLLGCYRTGEANDPEVFTDAVAVVLASFPSDIVQYVIDPRTGLPGRSKWMPNPAEVRAACEARVAELARQRRYDTWGQSREEQVTLPAPREQRLTLDELKAIHGPNWGIENKPLPNERA